MTDNKLDTVAVIGLGAMGSGIAQVSILGGIKTLVYDENMDALQTGLQNIVDSINKGVEKGRIDNARGEEATSLIEVVAELDEAGSRADLVIEAVIESLDVKMATMQKLDAVAPAHTVLATNTSALSVTEIAAATKRPSQVVGMHFFNPVPRMKLVEIIRGLDTSSETVERTAKIAERMQKEIVTVNESPGFVTSRVNAMIGNEAFDMLESGVATAEDIDRALKLGLNHPMGPFELVDLVGLDVRLAVLRHLHATLGDRYRPSQLLVKHVAAGRLGRKTGRGVYSYDENGKRV